ncbi:aminotransferase class I/II-fold pyridoxal phosphate-dependent enzyme [Cetobacterium sp. SF1]|uniref:aminotransferase class I/II-fold pyridoxal phosphate-dependent enzyme n=1 Tax=Cetobacterium sp. SF1 TaxID=3417654 RepID=UPI003CF1883F
MKLENIKSELNKLKNNNNLRSLKSYPNNLLNLSSNDYMGLAEDNILRKEFYLKYSNLPLSSSSSRLITGNFPLIEELEKKLKDIYGKSALTFNSGFDGNCCIIETFCNKDTLVLSDKLNHASIHDGIIHSGAKLHRYRHLDLDHLESLILKYKDEFSDIFVISETIYSMDGDSVDLEKLINLKKKYNFTLMIDEAHSYGVYSYGMAYELNLVEFIDFLIIPLGKGGGSIGAYLLTDKILKEYIINKGRKFIYTTALPPINIAWNLFLLEKMNSFQVPRNNLNELILYTHNLIKEFNLTTFSTSHIISILVGSNEKIDIICKNLIEKGFLVYPVKEPTVPKGTSRIRIGLNPNISQNDIYNFLKELKYELNSIL